MRLDVTILILLIHLNHIDTMFNQFRSLSPSLGMGNPQTIIPVPPKISKTQVKRKKHSKNQFKRPSIKAKPRIRAVESIPDISQSNDQEIIQSEVVDQELISNQSMEQDVIQLQIQDLATSVSCLRANLESLEQKMVNEYVTKDRLRRDPTFLVQNAPSNSSTISKITETIAALTKRLDQFERSQVHLP